MIILLPFLTWISPATPTSSQNKSYAERDFPLTKGLISEQFWYSYGVLVCFVDVLICSVYVLTYVYFLKLWKFCGF